MRLRICTYLFCCLTGACAVTPTDRPTSPYEIRFVPVTADITLAYLRANKLGPIRYLVLSHWHSDHSVGIGRYLEIYPDAVIISHPWTRKRIVKRLIDRVEVMAENLEREAITAREELATRLDLSPHDRAVTHGDPALEYFFDIWYRQPIIGRTIGEIEGR